MANRIWNIDGEDTKGAEGAVIKWDDEKYFTISFRGKTFFGEVLDEQTESNFIRLKINHREFEIRKKGELDDLIAALGMDKPKVRKLKELEAPMPGRILSVTVKVGDELEIGDEILSLEAMKMENVLKAEGVGKVKEIYVEHNVIVEKGAILISFE